jgi:rubrerythrin
MAQATVWRCQICGDSYLGKDAPTNCPFCGAHTEHILTAECLAKGLVAMNDVELTDVERTDLEAAVEIEITNLTFYKQLGEFGDRNLLLPSAYRALAKVENEHLGVFCKLLKIDKPASPKAPLQMTDSWVKNIELSHGRECDAVALYAKFAARATHPRVKMVFEAISAVESDHVVIDEYLERIAQSQ